MGFETKELVVLLTCIMDKVEGMSYLMGSCAASATDRPPSILGDWHWGGAAHGPSDRYPDYGPS